MERFVYSYFKCWFICIYLQNSFMKISLIASEETLFWYCYVLGGTVLCKDINQPFLASPAMVEINQFLNQITFMFMLMVLPDSCVNTIISQLDSCYQTCINTTHKPVYQMYQENIYTAFAVTQCDMVFRFICQAELIKPLTSVNTCIDFSLPLMLLIWEKHQLFKTK